MSSREKKQGICWEQESGEQRRGEGESPKTNEACKKAKRESVRQSENSAAEELRIWVRLPLHLQSRMAAVCWCLCASFLCLLSLAAPSLPHLLPARYANYCRERHGNLMATKKDGEAAITTAA